MRVTGHGASSSPARAPSGEQYEISAGMHRVVVTEVGATLRSYEYRGHPVVAGFDVGERSTSGRGQVLAPWPNRIRHGRYSFGGRDHQLPVDEPALGNAIHGLVRWAPWTVRERSPSAVTLAHTLFPRDGYPFLLETSVTYSLDADRGLTVHMAAGNAGTDTCPFACGSHPYFLAGPLPLDGWHLECPAGTRLLTDESAIPVGREAVGSTAFDFRVSRPIGATVLDTCFTDLRRDAGGAAEVHLAIRAGGEPALTVWMDEQFPYVMVFSADTLPAGQSRSALAVEPMTSAPDAFRSGEGLIRFEPGASWSGSWGVRPG